MKIRIIQITNWMGVAIEKYRKWFWLIGLVALVFSLFGDSYLISAIFFAIGLVFLLWPWA